MIVEQSLLDKKAVYLVGHGVDTVSKIYINNELVGTTDNMFVRYKFDVKSLLKVGQNNIRIVFESAVSYAKRKFEETVRTKYVIPPGMSNYQNNYNYS